MRDHLLAWPSACVAICLCDHLLARPSACVTICLYDHLLAWPSACVTICLSPSVSVLGVPGSCHFSWLLIRSLAVCLFSRLILLRYRETKRSIGHVLRVPLATSFRSSSLWRTVLRPSDPPSSRAISLLTSFCNKCLIDTKPHSTRLIPLLEFI